MSFAANVKKEILEKNYSNIENDVLLSAFIRNTGEITKDTITIVTENYNNLSYILSLLKLEYGISLDIERLDKTNFKHDVYRLFIKDASLIVEKLLLDKDSIDSYYVDSDDLRMAYLRGTFLASGSINDPKTSRYHLEFLIDKYSEALFIDELLNYFYLNSKIIKRDKGYMVYVKEAEKIGDFLRVIGVNRAVMYFEDIRIYRDHKNMTNRLNNCEQANVDKIIQSASSQIEDINIIIGKMGIDLLDERLQEVVIYRLKYPEVSLKELSSIITLETGKIITKSGLNHRLRKIKEIACKLRK